MSKFFLNIVLGVLILSAAPVHARVGEARIARERDEAKALASFLSDQIKKSADPARQAELSKLRIELNEARFDWEQIAKQDTLGLAEETKRFRAAVTKARNLKQELEVFAKVTELKGLLVDDEQMREIDTLVSEIERLDALSRSQHLQKKEILNVQKLLAQRLSEADTMISAVSGESKLRQAFDPELHIREDGAESTAPSRHSQR